MSNMERKRKGERLRHAAWSGLIALVISLLNLVGPLDQFVWIVQARMAHFSASGDIIFVGSEWDLSDPAFPERRENLARTLTDLKRAGADSVYLDVAFEHPSLTASDTALNVALRSFDGRAYLIRNLERGFGSESGVLGKSASEVGSGVAQLGGQRQFSWLGIVWQMPTSVQHDGTTLESAAVKLAGRQSFGGMSFPINYGFNLASIPSLQLSDLRRSTPAELATQFEDKKVVIGDTGSGAKFAIPGNFSVPGTMVHIYGAETLMAGFTQTVPIYLLLAAGEAVLVLSSIARRRGVRIVGYSFLVLIAPACIAVSTCCGVRASVSGLVVLNLIHLLFRLRSKWRKELLLVDQATGLPTFAALEGDRTVARQHPTIVVAKMHRFEEVRQSLAADLHAEYVLRIIDRINAASPETRIYLGPGHAIAWCTAEADPSMVKDHLEGLRALFASPLQVGGRQVDVGITFGIDISADINVDRRLAKAVAVVERTTETYTPILIAEKKTDDEMIWNISLQARIDAALAQGEIFLDYQPKIRSDTGVLTGLEALVRWHDPVRGLIKPDSFIIQCEEAGRMAHLTRYVLHEACRTGAQYGGDFSIAVNISATMVHDEALVAMVREVLGVTGFAPSRLTLEITETFRILDMSTANLHLKELTALGITISMDDFGAGAASLEALLYLPFTELKIDRIFIAQLTHNPRALGIVEGILVLAKRSRLTVVAEGVEDSVTLELLRAAGCPLAQGFAICRPTTFENAVLFEDRMQSASRTMQV